MRRIPTQCYVIYLLGAEHLDCMRNMKKYVEENALESSEPATLRLFSAVAAFMSRQLCDVVYRYRSALAP